MSPEQFDSRIGEFGGTADCITSGTYDVTSFVWTQIGTCGNTALFNDSGTVTRLSTQASLAALVDNSGNLLGGIFSLFGTAPDLGLTSWSLLAAGRLVDVKYDSIVSGISTNTGPDSLIALDYVADPLGDSFGSVLAWEPFTRVGQWGLGVDPWSTSLTSSDYKNVTGSAYFLFDRATFASPVPEPSTFALLGVGLVGVLVARRRTVS